MQLAGREEPVMEYKLHKAVKANHPLHQCYRLAWFTLFID